MSLLARHPVPPSASLPSLRDAGALTAAQIGSALRNLQTLYSPLPKSLDFQTHAKHDPLAVDSGYASEGDDDEIDRTEALRADVLERSLAVRWLTGFIGRAEELGLDELTCERLVEDACYILENLNRVEEVEAADDPDPGMTRQFEFFVKETRSPRASRWNSMIRRCRQAKITPTLDSRPGELRSSCRTSSAAHRRRLDWKLACLERTLVSSSSAPEPA